MQPVEIGELKDDTGEPRHAGGRPHAAGTVLARLMTERRLHVTNVSTALRVSDRQVYNYLIRKSTLRNFQIAALCDLLDMEPEELVSSNGYLLLDAE